MALFMMQIQLEHVKEMKSGKESKNNYTSVAEVFTFQRNLAGELKGLRRKVGKQKKFVRALLDMQYPLGLKTKDASQ